MTPPEKASAPQTIKIGKADGWDGVAPYFASYKGNTMHRDHYGYCDRYYTNNTGRNDIVGAKVARDADNVYFYVETADKLTPGDRPQLDDAVYRRRPRQSDRMERIRPDSQSHQSARKKKP